jgi:hypothetical protein
MFWAPYKTAKILSVKGSMNKVSIFVNHLQNETSQNQRGVTHQINHTVNFYNHSTVPHAIVALRNPAISISLLESVGKSSHKV